MFKKIGFLGSASALKPKIVMETFFNNLRDYNFEAICITNGDKGYYVDYCKTKNLKTIIINGDIINSLEENHVKLDLLICVGWPKKISNELLDYLNFKVINCHGSFLPDYRGSRAYMHYWANCEEFFGATIHYINDKFDDGNILAQQKLKLFKTNTPKELHYRTSELCAILLPKAIQKVFEGNSGYQGEGKKRYFKTLTHEEFKYYRRINEGNNHTDKVLTPHKVIND